MMITFSMGVQNVNVAAACGSNFWYCSRRASWASSRRVATTLHRGREGQRGARQGGEKDVPWPGIQSGLCTKVLSFDILLLLRPVVTAKKPTNSLIETSTCGPMLSVAVML